MRLSPAIWKHPLRTALLLALITRRTVLQRSTPHVSTDQRHRAIAELRRLVPPPPVFKLGERVTADTYARFLAICEWDAERAAKLLRRDFVWRAKYKPRLLKPSDMPIACSQRGSVADEPRQGPRVLSGCPPEWGTAIRQGYACFLATCGSISIPCISARVLTGAVFRERNARTPHPLMDFHWVMDRGGRASCRHVAGSRSTPTRASHVHRPYDAHRASSRSCRSG